MRLLYVHAPGDPHTIGGIQTYASELIEGMRGRGHEIRELAFDPEEILAGPLDRWPHRSYWHPEFLWKRQYYQDFRYHQAVQHRVEEEVGRFAPDLIHAMHVHQLGALEASALPSVVSCHGLELNEGELVRRSIHRAGAVHCNSAFTAGYLRSRQPGAPAAEILRWGVSPLPASGTSDVPHYDLVTVSRLVERKNIESLFRVLRERPGLRYAIVGDGPERERLERRVSEWGLEGVEFLGELGEPEKWRVLRRSRVFVLVPRRDLPEDVEGLGLVYYEAFAAGLPVIAARSGGVPEAVGSGGVLVEDPLSVSELGEAVDELLAAEAHPRWRAASRAWAEANSWEGFLDAFERFYERVAGRGAIHMVP